MKFYLLFVFIVVSNSVFSQNIHFSLSDNSIETFSLEDVKKMTFDNDDMTLHLIDGSSFMWNVFNIKNIQFDEEPNSTESILSKLNDLNFSIYPNPSSDFVTLSYDLYEADNIKIDIFSFEGKLTHSKLNEFQLDGNYNLKFNIQDLPNGIYFVQISGEKFRATKKIIIQ